MTDPTMPTKIKHALLKIWALPCKSVVLLVIVCSRWEGDLAKSGALPPTLLVLLGLCVALLFFDRGFPIKLCVALVILNFAARDNYPFSHFPMYDRFTDHTFYVFVADRDDQPVPLQDLTSIRTSRLKKPYDKDLNVIRKELGKRKRELTAAECAPAGRRALEQLYRSSNKAAQARLEALAPLRLYHANLYIRDGEIIEPEPERVAELDLPPK